MSDSFAVKEATQSTCAHQRAVAGELPFTDAQDFEDAARGFIATLPEVHVTHADGRVIYSLRDYAFLAAREAPASVNPSLWRQARLNMHHGLFRVCERIYQVRGFDISNMTIIEGDRGIIVIDPLISTETAAAALALYGEHRGKRPVTAVIYSHSHVDHFGGVRGVVDDAAVAAGDVAILAPDRFMEEVTKENVLAGTPMLRRAMFQFGATLPKGPRGQIDAGLGKVTSRGTVTLIAPTRLIRQPLEEHRIDSIDIVFQLTPDTEAPCEMHMFFPGLRALNLAENATHNLHNVYPIRGAQVRDANAWAKYLNEARDRFAADAAAAFVELPRRGRWRHDPRHALPLALRARQPVRPSHRRVLPRGAAHPRACGRDRQTLCGDRGGCRLRDLPARWRRRCAFQLLVGDARSPR